MQTAGMQASTPVDEAMTNVPVNMSMYAGTDTKRSRNSYLATLLGSVARHNHSKISQSSLHNAQRISGSALACFAHPDEQAARSSLSKQGTIAGEPIVSSGAGGVAGAGTRGTPDVGRVSWREELGVYRSAVDKVRLELQWGVSVPRDGTLPAPVDRRDIRFDHRGNPHHYLLDV